MEQPDIEGLADGNESIVNLAVSHANLENTGAAIQAEVYGDVVYVHSGSLLIMMDTLIRPTDTALLASMFSAGSARKVIDVNTSGHSCFNANGI